jgi:lipopolysaccharide transport system permease protein
MFKLTTKQKRWWEFLWAMTERELKVRYKVTKLGFYWMLLNPIFQMLIIVIVFQFLVSNRIDNYPVFVFIGIVVWNYFSGSVSKNVSIVTNERFLFQKSNFPRETMIFSTIIVNVVNLIISFLLVFVYLLILGSLNYKSLFFFPVALINLIFITLGLSLFLSAFNVKHRDIEFVFSAILPLWFYATPVIYSLDMLPRNIAWILYFNPLTGVIDGFRYSVLNLYPYSFLIGVLSLIVSFLIFIFALFYFKKKSCYFNDFI